MTVLRGDCVEVMAGMEPDSVDAIVCDPPYGLEFMGKEWDRLWDGREARAKSETYTGSDGVTRTKTTGFSAHHASPTYQAGAPAQRWHQEWATAALRVAKPGAYLLAFGGTRTVHRMTCALEDAGWVIRDMLVWAYASGFPKSRASLKPAWEPIVLARKPGASRDLRIDEARIGFVSDADRAESVGKNQHTRYANPASGRDSYSGNMPDRTDYQPGTGRWPSNVLLTSPIFDGGWDGVVGGGETTSGKMMPTRTEAKNRAVYGADKFGGYTTMETYGDTGTYSRFFLITDGRGSALSGTMDACRCTPADSAEPPTSTRETVPPTAPGHASPTPSEPSDLPACDAASPSLWGETSTAPSPAPTLPDGTLASTAIEDPALPTESSTRPPASGTLPAPPPGTTSLSGQSASPAGAPQTSTDITTTTAAPSTCGRCAGRVTTGSTPQPPRPSSGAQLPVEQPDHGRFYLVAKAPTSERVLSDGRRSPHPTQKPEALIRHLVTLVTPPDGLVLDPFLGSGTLGVVCEGLGVRWVGIEREPEYAQWAEDRIADGRPLWDQSA